MSLRVIEIEVYYLTLFRESWFETRDAFFEAPYICAILWQGCDAFVQEYTRILHYGLHPRSRFVHSLIKEGWDGASFGAWGLSKSQVRTLWWFPLLCNDFHGLVSHVQAFCEQFFYQWCTSWLHCWLEVLGFFFSVNLRAGMCTVSGRAAADTRVCMHNLITSAPSKEID